jgi:hypothetical protein
VAAEALDTWDFGDAAFAVGVFGAGTLGAADLAPRFATVLATAFFGGAADFDTRLTAGVFAFETADDFAALNGGAFFVLLPVVPDFRFGVTAAVLFDAESFRREAVRAAERFTPLILGSLMRSPLSLQKGPRDWECGR